MTVYTVISIFESYSMVSLCDCTMVCLWRRNDGIMVCQWRRNDSIMMGKACSLKSKLIAFNLL